MLPRLPRRNPFPPLPRSYAIKYIYGGPHAADFTTMDLCLNLMLTLLGFVPGAWRTGGSPLRP